MQLATSSRGRLYFHQLFPVIGASPNLFQNHLDTIPCQGLWDDPAGAGMWDQRPSCGPFQPVPSQDSVTLIQNWDLTHTQPGHRDISGGSWSSTEVQEKLKPMENF